MSGTSEQFRDVKALGEMKLIWTDSARGSRPSGKGLPNGRLRQRRGGFGSCSPNLRDLGGGWRSLDDMSSTDHRAGRQSSAICCSRGEFATPRSRTTLATRHWMVMKLKNASSHEDSKGIVRRHCREGGVTAVLEAQGVCAQSRLDVAVTPAMTSGIVSLPSVMLTIAVTERIPSSVVTQPLNNSLPVLFRRC